MIPRAMLAGMPVPDRCNLTGLVTGKRPDKGQPLALQVGVYIRPTTPPVKTIPIKEPLGPYKPHV